MTRPRQERPSLAERSTGLFPASEHAVAEEIREALELHSSVHPLREAASVLWAAGRAWRRYLATAHAVRQAAWVGAVVWFGFLVGIGPTLRGSIALLTPSATAPGLTNDLTVHLFALAALATGLLLQLSRSRWLSHGAGGGFIAAGVLGAALQHRVGEFQTASAFAYELRWLGFAAVIMLALKPRRAWLWPLMAASWIPLIFVLARVEPYQGYGAHNYGWFVRSTWWSMPSGNNWFDLLFALAVVGLVLLPFLSPAIGYVFAMPIAGMIMTLTAWNGRAETALWLLVLALYFGLVAMWHFRRPELALDLGRDADGRRRVALSWSWRKDRV